MNETGPSLYLKAERGRIAKYVIFSGDPWRVETLKDLLDESEHIAFAREFNTYTGSYKGTPITVSSTGIGAPSAAIAMEELYSRGMEVAVRMGTTMGLEDSLLGKFIIPTAVMREEATSDTYAPKGYPAAADMELVGCMNRAALAAGREYVNGITCSMDGFYSRMRESPLSNRLGIETGKTFEALKRYRVRAVDMESSCMLVLANLMGISACVVTMTTVLENLKETLQGAERTASEEVLCRVTLDGLVSYAQRS